MSSKNEKLTVRDQYKNLVRQFQQLEESPERQDLEKFQKSVAAVLKEFTILQSIVDSLSLFSENEQLKDINTSYLSFIAIPYYQSCLFMKLLADVTNGFSYDATDMLQYKAKNLQTAKVKLASFLHQLDTIGGILSKEQVKKLDSFKNSYNPSIDEINSLAGNPMTRRAEKIANFNLERELKKKLLILDDHYKNDSEGDDNFNNLDEEVVQRVYIDQLKLFSLQAFENLELLALELQVLQNRPVFQSQQSTKAKETPQNTDEFGYTTKVESIPNMSKGISDLINKQGKILQPFTITNTKQNLREKVFGTGQVLPSMTVEEYLDYELANGKMLKEEAKDTVYSSDEDEENSDKELEKRQWDDWKDDHPKGSGNMKGNIG